ncbi:hypothetical protein Pelo_11196 [Pelomyxa schiedti]|nr:hypothetical protein Pelo_11196 [Pelomyxa schiedti]
MRGVYNKLLEERKTSVTPAVPSPSVVAPSRSTLGGGGAPAAPRAGGGPPQPQPQPQRQAQQGAAEEQGKQGAGSGEGPGQQQQQQQAAKPRQVKKRTQLTLEMLATPQLGLPALLGALKEFKAPAKPKCYEDEEGLRLGLGLGLDQNEKEGGEGEGEGEGGRGGLGIASGAEVAEQRGALRMLVRQYEAWGASVCQNMPLDTLVAQLEKLTPSLKIMVANIEQGLDPLNGTGNSPLPSNYGKFMTLRK